MGRNSFTTTVFDQAADHAESLELGIRAKEREAAAHLRYAMLKLIEGDPEAIADFYDVGEYRVMYGEDDALAEQLGDEVDWWAECDPHRNASRIRVEPLGGTMTERASRLLDAIGAVFVLHERSPEPDTMPAARGSEMYHFIQKHESPVIESYRDHLRARHYADAREEQAGLE